MLENDISRFQTEPDAMLVIGGELVVCVEAKFSSGNPLAYEGPVIDGAKPTDRQRLIRRYRDLAGRATQFAIDTERMSPVLHSQLFRNVVFASEMANGCDWHVVNLVSSTQWQRGKDSQRYHVWFEGRITTLDFGELVSKVVERQVGFHGSVSKVWHS